MILGNLTWYTLNDTITIVENTLQITRLYHVLIIGHCYTSNQRVTAMKKRSFVYDAWNTGKNAWGFWCLNKCSTAWHFVKRGHWLTRSWPQLWTHSFCEMVKLLNFFLMAVCLFLHPLIMKQYTCIRVLLKMNPKKYIWLNLVRI